MALSSNQLWSAFSYALCSVLILIFNKIILSSYSFNFPVLMTLCHQVVCIVLLALLKNRGYIKFAEADRQTIIKALPLSICFVLNIVIGMAALRLTSIPMFSTLRRLTVLIVIVSEYIILQKKAPLNVVISVCIMGIGAVVGGWADLEFDLIGYSLVLANDAVTACYLVLVKRTFNDDKFKKDTFGVLYLNSVASLPFLIVLALITGEMWRVFSFPHLGESDFQLGFLASALLSFAMNYCIFWCTEANSPLTTSVTGQVKNALCSLVSIMFLHVQYTLLFLVGLSIGVTGSALYAAALYQASPPPQQKAEVVDLEMGKDTAKSALLSGSEKTGEFGSHHHQAEEKTNDEGETPKQER